LSFLNPANDDGVTTCDAMHEVINSDTNNHWHTALQPPTQHIKRSFREEQGVES